MVITPDVVDWWEALLTILAFPILVVVAWRADVAREKETVRKLCIGPMPSDFEFPLGLFVICPHGVWWCGVKSCPRSLRYHPFCSNGFCAFMLIHAQSAAIVFSAECRRQRGLHY